MLLPTEYEHLCDDLIKLYADLDNAIISDIVRRLLINGEMTETAKWQAKQLQESGMLYDDIIAEIANRTEATQNQIRALFEDAGVESVRNDNVRYREAGLAGIIKLSPAAMQVLDAGYKKCSGNLSNLTLTTANTAQQAYITACNNAYMQVVSGAFDYNTAIRNAVKAAAQDGTWVLYPSGHRDRIDVAVRRAVLTGVGQTVRQLSSINANEMGCDLMEITAHSGARPSHAEWQGKLVSMSGKKAGRIISGCRVLSLDEIGYGSGDGFGGWNCRHDWYPFFEGISSRAYSDDDIKTLNEKSTEYNGEKYSDYDITQIQRKFERDIRSLKREAAAYDSGRANAQNEQLRQQFSEDFNKAALKLKEKERQLKDFLDQTGQRPDDARTHVLGFGRSQARKAVWAGEKANQGLTTLSKDDTINSKNKVEYSALNKKVKESKQREHTFRDKRWTEESRKRVEKGDNPNAFIYDNQNAQDLVNKYSGKNKLIYRKNSAYPIEFATADTPVGKTFDKKVGKYVETKRFAIVYSKKGVHIYPVIEKEDD